MVPQIINDKSKPKYILESTSIDKHLHSLAFNQIESDHHESSRLNIFLSEGQGLFRS